MPNYDRKLTEKEEIALRAWYYSERTVKGKAKELGISVTALHNYINRKHKVRKSIDLTKLIDRSIYASENVSRETNEGDGCTPSQL